MHISLTDQCLEGRGCIGLFVNLLFLSRVETNSVGGATYRALPSEGHDEGMGGVLTLDTERGTPLMFLEFHSLRERKTCPKN